MPLSRACNAAALPPLIGRSSFDERRLSSTSRLMPYIEVSPPPREPKPPLDARCW